MMYFPCVSSRFKEDELKYKLTKAIKDNNIREMLNELIEWNKNNIVMNQIMKLIMII